MKFLPHLSRVLVGVLVALAMMLVGTAAFVGGFRAVFSVIDHLLPSWLIMALWWAFLLVLFWANTMPAKPAKPSR